MREIVLTVPGPFFGVDSVGFSVRYPAEAGATTPLDVPVLVEGDPDLLAPLTQRLRLFSKREWFVDCAAIGEAYTWSEPIALSAELVVIAFRDCSLQDAGGDAGTQLRNRTANAVIPLIFPFLRDCVRVGQLRLNSEITVSIRPAGAAHIDLSLPALGIVAANGPLTLGQL